MQFEWDEAKNQTNIRKHGISFDEAKTAFYDESARIIHDPDHSDREDRYIMLGMSYKLQILVVVHAYRQSDEVIRLISARKASRNEVIQYEKVN